MNKTIAKKIGIFDFIIYMVICKGAFLAFLRFKTNFENMVLTIYLGLSGISLMPMLSII